MRAVVWNEVPRDAEVGTQWNALATRMEEPHVFFTHEWMLAAAEAFTPRVRPMIVGLYRGTALVGVAALATRPGQESSAFFLGASTADYCDVVSDVAEREAVVGETLAELARRGVGRIVLGNIPQASTTLEALRAGRPARGFHRRLRRAYLCPRLTLGGPDQREAIRAGLAHKKTIANTLKALRRRGEVAVSHTTDASALGEDFDRFVETHVARFFATGRISPLVAGERRRFIERVCRLLSGRGHFVLSRLHVGGRTVAWHVGFRFEDTWFWYLPTFDVGLERFGVGMILLSAVIARASEMPDIGTVDFGLGDEWYKTRFANATNAVYEATLSRTLPAHVRAGARAIAGDLLRRSPRMEAWVRAARRAVNGGHRAGAPRLRRARAVGFRWNAAGSDETSAPLSPPLTLRELSWALVARIGLDHEDDRVTLDYLARTAARLRKGDVLGFGFVDPDGRVVHVCWVAGTDPTSPTVWRRWAELDGVVLFDWWTPPASRARGVEALAWRLVARHFAALGRNTWIFVPGMDTVAVKALESMGFDRTAVAGHA